MQTYLKCVFVVLLLNSVVNSQQTSEYIKTTIEFIITIVTLMARPRKQKRKLKPQKVQKVKSSKVKSSKVKSSKLYSRKVKSSKVKLQLRPTEKLLRNVSQSVTIERAISLIVTKVVLMTRQRNETREVIPPRVHPKKVNLLLGLNQKLSKAHSRKVKSSKIKLQLRPTQKLRRKLLIDLQNIAQSVAIERAIALIVTKMTRQRKQTRPRPVLTHPLKMKPLKINLLSRPTQKQLSSKLLTELQLVVQSMAIDQAIGVIKTLVVMMTRKRKQPRKVEPLKACPQKVKVLLEPNQNLPKVNPINVHPQKVRSSKTYPQKVKVGPPQKLRKKLLTELHNVAQSGAIEHAIGLILTRQ